MLIENLPPESATMRRLRGDPWGAAEHLIADTYDAVRMSEHNLARAQGAKPRKPKPHPRPTDKQPERIGHRGDHSQESVLAWINERKPPKKVPSERLPSADAVRGGVLLDPPDPLALEGG